MSATTDLERWLRTDFVDLNTALEEAYAGGPVTARAEATVLRDDGAALVGRIDDLPVDQLARYQLLGAVGFYLAACARHGVAAPEQAQAVAARLGLSLGVAPRFVFAHASTHNPTVDGVFRTFTRLPDEHTFITYNALGVLAYERAAAALRAIPAVGVSGRLAGYLLDEAAAALGDVLRFSRQLAAELDVDRFFHNVRSYFTVHEVCGVTYRGPNAGDFAAVNEIDLLLGLCDPRDPFYQRILAEKYPYLPPEHQPRLRATPVSLLELFEADGAANVERYLAVCRAHGAAYSFHHHKLVRPYLVKPAGDVPPDGISASGPPLDVVVAGLARLVDLRAALDRPGTARVRLARLRSASAVPSAAG